jgi:adenylate cyclase
LALLWWKMPPATEPPATEPPVERAAAPLSDRASIAVLPFENMSDDPSQEYFADGMTEDLITDLSKISSLFVIARNSVFTYKNQPVKAQRVAEELGVRYILEGSVRRAGSQVRINAQLIDAATGGHLWAERFDKDLGDIFALQDDVTRKIVSALELELTTDEKAGLRRASDETSPEVYDLYLRGVDRLRQFTPESISQARMFFLKALSLDPGYARAYATMAFTFTAAGIFFNSERADEAIDQALYYGEKALELDDTLPQGYFAMSIARLRQGRHEEALAAAREAIKFDPNYADGYVALANVLFFSGEGEEAEVMMRKAMELNPRYSAAYIDILGRAFFVMGRYDEAISEFRECVSRNPESLTCHVFLAAAYGLTGRIEDAQWETEEVLTLEPDYSLRTDTIAPQIRKTEDRERFQSGLRQAGIP